MSSMTKATGRSRSTRPVWVCGVCGRTIHTWRGGWRHSRGFTGATPVDHEAQPMRPGEYVDPEAAALRRALGQDQ